MAGVVTISAKQVAELLSMDELIKAVERGLAYYSEGKDGGVVQPVRTVLKVENPGGDVGFFGGMPVYSAKDEVLACKVGSFYPSNGKHGKPTHLTTVMLYDPKYGELKAIIDGDVVTEMRTAAASAVASKYLVAKQARPLKLALLGAGVQARSHCQALKCLFQFSKISIWSRTMESAMKCAEDVNGEAFLSAEEAVENADIIVTVSFSQSPILKKSWVKQGAHINAVGACRPDWQEIDPELMRSSVVYVDSRDAAMKEAGDIILSNAEIYAEVGEIVNDIKEVKYGQTTVFKSLGMAMEDAVSAKLIYDTYKAKQETS